MLYLYLFVFKRQYYGFNLHIFCWLLLLICPFKILLCFISDIKSNCKIITRLDRDHPTPSGRDRTWQNSQFWAESLSQIKCSLLLSFVNNFMTDIFSQCPFSYISDYSNQGRYDYYQKQAKLDKCESSTSTSIQYPMIFRKADILILIWKGFEESINQS